MPQIISQINNKKNLLSKLIFVQSLTVTYLGWCCPFVLNYVINTSY